MLMRNLNYRPMKKKTGTSAGIPKDMRSPISNGGPMTQVSSLSLLHPPVSSLDVGGHHYETSLMVS